MISNNKSPVSSRMNYPNFASPNYSSIQISTIMKIFIASLDHEFAIEITSQDTIIEIKRKIEQFIGIPAGLLTLSIYGCELVDGLDMEDYQFISEGSRIDLSINQTTGPPIINPQTNKLPITVKFSGRQINIEVDRTETVHSLKEKIHIIDGTPIQRMLLFHCGVELGDDYRNLSEFGIREFSEVIVFLKSMSRVSEAPSRKVSFVVQTSSSLLNAASIPMEMKDSGTVEEVRKWLLAGKILPADDYLFIHKQRIMRDKCSLRWHGVDNGDFLYVFKGTVSRGEY